MGYIEDNLAPGEKVIYKTRLHWIVMLWPLLAAAILAGLGIASSVAGNRADVQENWQQGSMYAGLALLVCAVILIAVALVRRNRTEVAVSNMRVLIKTGVFARKSIEVLLPQVESIGVNETVPGRILGYGSVVIRGTGGTFETFHDIAHPNEFRRQVQGQIGSAQPR
jgi:uncharacterized membrane protein YdbT with pleckstrin-like domain